MILRQFLHTEPVIATSYLFGCGSHSAGAVVDAVGEPGRYLEAAAAVGLRLRYVIDKCGRGLSGKPTSTIGFERRFNRAFSLADEESFVRLMLQEIPSRPERAQEIRAANLGLPLSVEA